MVESTSFSIRSTFWGLRFLLIGATHTGTNRLESGTGWAITFMDSLLRRFRSTSTSVMSAPLDLHNGIRW